MNEEDILLKICYHLYVLKVYDDALTKKLLNGLKKNKLQNVSSLPHLKDYAMGISELVLFSQ